MIESQNQLSTRLCLSAAEAKVESQMLMRRTLGDVCRAWLITHDEEVLTEVQLKSFSDLLKRRCSGEPIAYILGMREFYGLEFLVTPAVLIPRADTETLVEAAVAKISPGERCNVLDLGTGSGILAITIAAHCPQASVTATDASPLALEVARKNADRLVSGRVELLSSNWFSALQGRRFDVIVSNPPYIAESDPHLVQGDLRFEPPSALASGADGLNDIRTIIQAAPDHLNAGAWLLLEHGFDQAEAVSQLLSGAGFTEISSLTDLGGHQRVTQGRWLRD